MNVKINPSLSGFLFFITPLLLVLSADLRCFGQNSQYEYPDENYAIVTALKVNVRGTPDIQGAVVTSAVQNEVCGLIAKKGRWYLIQTKTHVGWVHETTVRPSYSAETQDRLPRPRTTTVVRSSESPFSSEYIGGNQIIVLIKNDSAKTLNLTLGGVKYVVSPGASESIELVQGTYDYFASAVGVRPLSGSQGFEWGHRYTWVFYIVTTYR